MIERSLFAVVIALPDPREEGAMDARPPLGPISFIFMQFSAQILQINRFLSQIQGLASPSGKSWIRHCIELKKAPCRNIR